MTSTTQDVIREQSDGSYLSDAGLSARRENGTTPNGNPVGGHWVLRDKNGKWMGMNQYRHDLFERFDLRTA